MTGRGGDRGQINFDFTVGIGILVVTIVIAFSFVPSIFGGVTEGRQQSDKVVADRVGEWLVTEGLADPENPRELDLHCTNSFFSPASELSHCSFDSDEVEENLPSDYDRFVKITIERSGDVQCWRGPNWRQGVVDSAPDPACVGDYSVGGESSQGSEIAVSRRKATLAGKDVMVVVRVW